MLTVSLACARCVEPFRSESRPLRLHDLSFHQLCAPACRACGSLLLEGDEERWSYGARVVSALNGYELAPTEFWCESCWELSARDESYAQD